MVKRGDESSNEKTYGYKREEIRLNEKRVTVAPGFQLASSISMGRVSIPRMARDAINISVLGLYAADE